jgi:hypothetical protein
MCAQKISSIVWAWTLSTGFVYGTDCFGEVVCSGKSQALEAPWPAMEKGQIYG